MPSSTRPEIAISTARASHQAGCNDFRYAIALAACPCSACSSAERTAAVSGRSPTWPISSALRLSRMIAHTTNTATSSANGNPSRPPMPMPNAAAVPATSAQNANRAANTGFSGTATAATEAAGG